MKIRKIETKDIWNTGVADQQLSFLQSWEWGEFQRKMGNSPLRFEIQTDEESVYIQGFRISLGFGQWFGSFPHVGGFTENIWETVFQELKTQGAIFIRIEPLVHLPISAGYKVVPTLARQPQQTLILPIIDEAAQLAGFHTKTRYNIRLAQKKGVQVRTEKNASVFMMLNNETTARDHFKSHDEEYYAHFLEMAGSEQFTAYSDEKAVASIICVGYGDTFTYVHGASSDMNRELMAPYLLQWEALQFARTAGYKNYDFWGVAPLVSEENKTQIADPQCFNGFCWESTHKWSGITRFKVGFGGTFFKYGKPLEIVLQKYRYMLLQFGKKLRTIGTH